MEFSFYTHGVTAYHQPRATFQQCRGALFSHIKFKKKNDRTSIGIINKTPFKLVIGYKYVYSSITEVQTIQTERV